MSTVYTKESFVSTMSITNAAEKVIEVLGERLTMMVTGHKNSEDFDIWSQGIYLYDDHARRLKSALRAIRELKIDTKDSDIKIWFFKANPYLSNKAPYIVLNRKQFDLMGYAILQAAKNHVK